MPVSDTSPNILLIMPDQMRGDCLSLEAHPVLSTPNIDALGSGGTHFTAAYTTCASCIPARRALLTGCFPATNGMVGFRDGVPLRHPSFVQRLQEGGYATALAGRHMHQWPYYEPYGFERQMLGSTYVLDDDYAQFLRREAPAVGDIHNIGLSTNGWHARPWPLPEALHPNNWIVARARDMLHQHEAHEARPLFLTTSFFAPHSPLFPPNFYFQRYLDLPLPEPAVGSWATTPPERAPTVDAYRAALPPEAQRRAQAGYFGLVNHIDDQLYWLITEFKDYSRRIGRPWLIIFTTDHGDMLGDHHLWRKCQPYEGSSRIPLLIHGDPALGLASGQQCAQPVCLEDLAPTLLELAGLPLPDHFDGQSLVPLLRGEDIPWRPYLHGEHAPTYGLDQAYHFLSDGHWKYVWRPTDGSEQLFNLQEDPHELHNLAADPTHSTPLHTWRERLVQQLQGRPEGFSDGSQLHPGRPYQAVLPQF